MTNDASRVGLHDHERFLRQYPPFSALGAARLAGLVRDLEVVYRPAGSTFDTAGGLYVLRRGEIELGGEQYGGGETLGGGVRVGAARALSDSWLYVLPPERAGPWLNDPAVRDYLTSALSARLSRPGQGLDLSSVPVGEIMTPAQLCPPTHTVGQAAAQMRAARVSCVLVPLPAEPGPTEPQTGDPVSGRPPAGSYGILTDKDLRNKVLAEGLGPQTPVWQVMTAPAHTAPDELMTLSALNLMFRLGIRHLPLTRGGELVGVVGTAELLRLQTRGVGYVVQDLLDAPDEATLAAHARRLPEYTANLARAGHHAEHLARLASYAYDALYRRAIELAQAELAQGEPGPAPGDFCWLLLGSVARRESGLNPDQDHLLLIEREEDRAYFLALAGRVEATLERAGLERCDGGVMASRHLYTREQYLARLREWLRVPEPQALLNVTIFFDPRVVAGTLDVSGVRAARLAAGHEPAFMAHLTRLAVGHRPPLGFRQRLRPGDTLDLKTQGLALIIDLARLHALRVGEPSASTFVRLRASGDSLLHPETREDLLGAYRYLLDLRLELQVAQLGRGEAPGHRLRVDDLSGPQEVHLREIFKMIGRVQAVLAPQVGGL